MSHNLLVEVQVLMNGRQAIKTTYFFRPGEAPENYAQVRFLFKNFQAECELGLAL